MPGTWAVTAAGLVTSAGDTAESMFEALLAGTTSDPAAVQRPGGPATRGIPDFDPRRYVKRKGLKHLSRTSQLACAAASRLASAFEGEPVSQIGVVFGTAWASLDSVVRFEREAHVEGPRFVDPILFTETVANVPAGQISIFFGWSALNATVASGTSSGIEALCRAMAFLEEGRARRIVAGGGDELNPHLVEALHAEGRLTGNARSVPVAAEGACLLALAAHDRSGGGATCVLCAGVTGFVDPQDDRGPARRLAMLRDVLARAELPAAALDLVVLSGNGDPQRGALECELLRGLFERGQQPAPVYPKAVLGETWGAAGPLSVVVAAETMRRSIVPPVPAGFDPGPVAWNTLPCRPEERPVRHALVLDCAETGQVSMLVVGRGA